MDHLDKFIIAFETLIIKMQKIDASCVEAYCDVSKREFSLLVMLGKSEKMIMKEVADFLNVPVSTATAVIDKLTEKGYLKRVHSSTDRRVILVVLSDEGRAIYVSLRSKLKAFARDVMNKLEESEKEKFVYFLEKVAA